MSVIVGVDFGGVVANHTVIKCQIARERYGLSVSPGPEASREVMTAQIGAESYHQLLLETGARLMEFPLIAGAKAALINLHDRGYKLVCVTMQKTQNVRTVEAYFRMHGVPIDETFVVLKDEEKYRVCANVQPWAFIDDNRTVLKLLEDLNTNLVWMDSLRTNEQSDYLRVETWEDVLALFTSIENRKP